MCFMQVWCHYQIRALTFKAIQMHYVEELVEIFSQNNSRLFFFQAQFVILFEYLESYFY